MIAGDWPNGAGKNLIKSPPRTRGISKRAIDDSHVHSHYSRRMHNKCIANTTRPAVCPQTRFDLGGARVHAYVNDTV